jgi:hypothetical protein
MAVLQLDGLSIANHVCSGNISTLVAVFTKALAHEARIGRTYAPQLERCLVNPSLAVIVSLIDFTPYLGASGAV